MEPVARERGAISSQERVQSMARLQGRAGARPVAPAPKPAAAANSAKDAAASRLRGVLEAEDRIRAAKTLEEIRRVIADEMRAMSGARQAFVFEVDRNSTMRLNAVSSVKLIERNSEFVEWAQSVAEKMSALCGQGLAHRATMSELRLVNGPGSYPFTSLCWLSLKTPKGDVFGGVLLAKETAFSDAMLPFLVREAGVCAHALTAGRGGKIKTRLADKGWFNRKTIAMAVVGAMLFPVPMTTMAPVEVVSRNAFVVTAPLSGVIEKVHVLPDSKVRVGQPVLSFVDTELRNGADLAQQALAVAEAAYRRTSQAAFADEEARRELLIRKSERDLKKAELDYARDLLQRAQVRSEKPGTAVFANVDDLEGRPVEVGQRLMEIATPGEVSLDIELPVADAIVLENGAFVRVFLDRDPLSSLTARVVRSTYKPVPEAGGRLVYKLKAELEKGQQAPRIGSRGTAQLYGDWVVLGFYLFRRPIAAARQFFGF